MENAITSSLRRTSWAISCVLFIGITLQASSPKLPPIIRKEFYTPIYSQNATACPQRGCSRALVICRYEKEHQGKTCEFCLDCDKKCKVCPEDFTQCALCLENHPIEDEVVLKCDHIFGRECLNEAITNGYHKCPICRVPIEYKETSHCEFCDSEILVSERSCSYTCCFRVAVTIPTRRHRQKHILHERCIRGIAEKNAFKLKSDGIVYFRCLLEHSERVETGSDLFVPALPIFPVLKDIRHTLPVLGSTTNACEICHKQVYSFQKETTYRCQWARDWSLLWGCKDHLFHEECLKPIAERRARKNDLGNYVFFCPGDHNDGLDTSIAHQHHLEINLLPGFVPQKKVDDMCPICITKVDRYSSEAAAPLRYNNLPRGLRGPHVNEKLFCHKKCLTAYILKYNSIVRPWFCPPERRIPCPAHLLMADLTHSIILTEEEHLEICRWIG